ncbi:MAG: beta-ketoacyl synthase N-terminal-like domain-containing protein, partial [Rhodothermales bacterium]
SDAGFPDGEGLPRASTGVVLGNTLTGEFSRAHQMRLRWPYVRRVLDDALAREGWSPEQRRPFLDNLAARYKAPFPHVGTETLAGGLSNTIAGRVCNYFDLKGGGFTVDGACASSLLAVINACTALASGDLEYALAGGVDLSLDPFELVGFAKVGALAAERMRVYDARSNGFWPGEGCGFVVLMRHEDALRQGRRIYAVIQGWGVSSDGSGGITRPEVEGQLLALRRAYRRAAFGIETVALFEGHGTGTSVGDAVELRMLSRLRREASTSSPPAVIGSVKANIGHTKAAAGIAGLIKATLALHHQMLPPTTGCETPHPELTGEAPALRILKGGEPWEEHASLRAGVSAMGFGGINTHVVLESTAPRRPTAFDHQERILLTSAQDAELFLLGAPDTAGLRTRVEHLLTFSSKLSLSELTDLAAHFAATLDDRTVRAAVVASTPSELTKRLKNLKVWLEKETTVRLDKGVYLSSSSRLPRIGFLFPGQGSPAHLDGGALIRRFPSIRTLYEEINLPGQGDGIATDVAQPAIVAATIAGLHVLDHMGVTASLAVGHSLGELTALHWAGAFDRQTLLEIARVRGRAMAELGNPSGAMAGIGAGPKIVETLIEDEPVVIAGLNGPRQTVIAGDKNAITSVIERARANGLSAYSLAVSHAFHSPLVASAVEPLAAYLERCETHPLQHKVVSTITGKPLASNEDLAALL